MNHSDDWRFLFPVSSFSAPPSLAPSAPDAYGPLLFTPLPPPATLLTLPFPFQPPHPSTSTSGLRDDLRYFLSRSTSFLPSSDLDSISGTLLAPPFPPPSNLLAALRTRSSRSLLLFFPSGENAEHVSYVALDSIANSISTTPLSPTLESDGFVHPGHRIHQLATTSRDSSWSWPPSQSAAGVEGFLLAATLHSVNWFKVEWRSVAGSPAAALVPAAKQAFNVGVVHACWSKHLQSECLVLLENGQLCCFDLDTRRQMKLGFGNSEDDDRGIWLSCEYGPQPWTVIVASTKAIFLVDLRYGDHCEYKVLGRVGMQGLLETESIVKTECRYLAFCKAPFDDLLISVVTQRHLVVFDIRQPLAPVLAWQHGLDNPNHLAMFRLSELRPSKEHEWASNSGIAILVGSLWGTEFNLFFCGPKEQGSTQNARLYAWDVSSRISLTGHPCSCSKRLMEEVFAEPSALQLITNSIIGYHVLPNAMLESSFTGFAFIRLTSSGKLELQRFRASGDLHDDVMCAHSQHKSVASRSSISLHTDRENFSSRYMFLKFHYLSKYLEGSLRSALENHGSNVNKHSRQIVISEDVSAFAKDNSESCYQSVPDHLCNASVPMNIFEIACQSILNRLSSDALLVAFSKYNDMLACSKERHIYEYLEVPACFRNNNKLRPFLLAKSSSIGKKLTGKAISGNALVGPVLPVPLLLAMEDTNKGTDSHSQGETSSVSHRCREVFEAFAPEVSTANADKFSGWSAPQELKNKKPYFVYEPQIDNRPTVDETARKKGKEAHVLDGPSCLHTSTAPHMDENLTTFVCGRARVPHSGPEQAASNLFDVSPVRMDFELPVIDIPPAEQIIYKRLKRQFLSWQNNFKPYQDFCNSHQIQKPRR